MAKEGREEGADLFRFGRRDLAVSSTAAISAFPSFFPSSYGRQLHASLKQTERSPTHKDRVDRGPRKGQFIVEGRVGNVIRNVQLCNRTVMSSD